MGEFNLKDWLKEAIISYYSGYLTSDQANDLLVWISQSADNLKHFQQLGELWHSTAILSTHEYDAAKAFDSITSKKGSGFNSERTL